MILVSAGCAPALVAGGAGGGYKAATDERSMGDMLDDASIAARVKSDLIKDAKVKARNIDVDAIEGTVILTGLVDTQEEAERAGKIAEAVPHVKAVKNNLRVGKKTIGETVDDKIIGGRIKGKLITEPGKRSLNIDVDVNKGVVSLTGIVRNAAQKERIIKIARETEGVVDIIDNLRVKE